MGSARFLPLLALFFCIVAKADNFIVGVCAHFAQGTNEPVQTIKMMRAAGITSFRAEAPWERIETRKGEFKFPANLAWVEQAVNLAVENKMQPLMILNYGNKLYGKGYPVTDEEQAAFVRYAEFLATHFKGRIKYYEVWNEWNTHGHPVDYTRLLKKVYPALKKIDPSIIVLGGAVEGAGPTTFVETMVREGALSALDGLSIHPYVFWRGIGGTPEALRHYVEDLQERVLIKANGGKPVSIYITEAGWPNNAGDLGVEPARVGDYLSRTLLLLRTLPYVRGIWWYDFRNDGEDKNSREHNFGLVSTKYVPKPAYASLQHTADLATNGVFIERLPTEPDVWALKFRKPDNNEVVVTWHTRARGRWQVDFDPLASPNRSLNLRRLGKDAQQVPAQAQANILPIEISETPLLIDSTNVKRISKAQ